MDLHTQSITLHSGLTQIVFRKKYKGNVATHCRQKWSIQAKPTLQVFINNRLYYMIYGNSFGKLGITRRFQGESVERFSSDCKSDSPCN